MRKIPYFKYSLTALLTLSVVSTGIMSLSSLVYAQNRSVPLEDRLVSSYPLSFPLVDSPKTDSFQLLNEKVYMKSKGNTLEQLNFNEGILDKTIKLFYYTKKSTSSWGSEKYIYVYSFKNNKVIKKIEFDNSGYHKFPIAISPDSKTLVLAERAQSIGETNISFIDINTGKTKLNVDKTYSPSGSWINNKSFAYLTTRSMCENLNCKQTGVDVSIIDTVSKKIKSKNVFNIDESGKLPNYDKIEYSDNQLKVSRRLDENRRENNSEDTTFKLNFNEIL